MRRHSGQHGLTQNSVCLLNRRTGAIDILTGNYIKYLWLCDWVLKMENSSLPGYLYVVFIKSLFIY